MTTDTGASATEKSNTNPQKEDSSSGFSLRPLAFWWRRFLGPGTKTPNSPSFGQISGTSSNKSSASSESLSLDIEGSNQVTPMQIESPGSVRAEGSAHVNITRLDLSDRTMSALALGAAMLAIGLAVLAVVLSQIGERESRLAQQDAMLLKASLVAHGVPIDEDQLHRKESRVAHNDHHLEESPGK